MAMRVTIDVGREMLRKLLQRETVAAINLLGNVLGPRMAVVVCVMS